MKNELKNEYEEFIKEKEKIREIVGKIGGKDDSQHKIISMLFLIVIVAILIAGVVLKKIPLTVTLELSALLGIFKIILIIYDSQKAMHFQFWVLNSIEFRINEIDRKQKAIDKKLSEVLLKEELKNNNQEEINKTQDTE